MTKKSWNRKKNIQRCQSNWCSRWKTFILKWFSSAWARNTNNVAVLFILTAGLCCGVPAVSDLPGLRGSRWPWSQPPVSGRLPELPVLLPSGGGGGEQKDRLLLRHLVGRGRRTHHLVSQTAGCRAAALAELIFLVFFFFYCLFRIRRAERTSPNVFLALHVSSEIAWTSCCSAAAASNEAVTSDLSFDPYIDSETNVLGQGSFKMSGWFNWFVGFNIDSRQQMSRDLHHRHIVVITSITIACVPTSSNLNLHFLPNPLSLAYLVLMMSTLTMSQVSVVPAVVMWKPISSHNRFKCQIIIGWQTLRLTFFWCIRIWQWKVPQM